MKGLHIFLHSVRQITGNLDSALRISALPFTIQILAALILLGPAGYIDGADPKDAFSGAGMFFMIALNLGVAVFTSVWIAVAWHRFVLRNEIPQGFVPEFQRGRSWAYFNLSFGIGLLCSVAVIPLSVVFGLIAAPVMAASGTDTSMFFFLILVVYLPIVVISYRFSTVLPGCALDAKGAFTAGWDATRGQTGSFILLGVVSGGSYALLAQLGLFLFESTPIFYLAWNVMLGWAALMVGLSILTTLYGHYIEKRPLV